MVLLNMDTENAGYAGGATEAAADGVNRDGKDVSAECAARAELKGTLAAAAKSAEREGLSIGKEFRSAEGGVSIGGKGNSVDRREMRIGPAAHHSSAQNRRLF